MTGAPQLSVAVASHEVPDCVNVPALQNVAGAIGQTITGGILSCNVTVDVHDETLPFASVAESVIGITPPELTLCDPNPVISSWLYTSHSVVRVGKPPGPAMFGLILTPEVTVGLRRNVL